MKITEYMYLNSINAQNLASKAGLSFATVYNVMQGKTINLASAKKLVKATGGLVTYEDLLPKEIEECEDKPNHKTGTA